MKKALAAGVGVLLGSLGSSSVAFADEKPVACSLLTNDEVQGAIGEKTTGAQAGELPIKDGPLKGEAMKSCAWGTPSGMFYLHLMRAPKNDSEREEGLKLIHEGIERLKSKGWTAERKTVGGTKCSVVTPPADSKLGWGPAASCWGEAKGKVILLGTGGRVQSTVEKVKALYDLAVGRL